MIPIHDVLFFHNASKPTTHYFVRFDLCKRRLLLNKRITTAIPTSIKINQLGTILRVTRNVTMAKAKHKQIKGTLVCGFMRVIAPQLLISGLEQLMFLRETEAVRHVMSVMDHLENLPGSQRTAHIRTEYTPRERLVKVLHSSLAKSFLRKV